MQIFKLLPAVCAVGICASFISVRAQDTPVQAAARAALEQKMKELDAPQTQAPPVVVTSPGAVKVQPNQPTTKTVPAKATAPATTATIPAATATIPAATATTPTTNDQQYPAGHGHNSSSHRRTIPAAAATTTSETNAAPAASETTPAAPIATTPAETVPATPPPAETKPAPMTTPVEPAAAATIASETNAAPAASETDAAVATMPAAGCTRHSTANRNQAGNPGS